jgi:hypothetical protein
MIRAICLAWFNALVKGACGAGISGTLKITGLLGDSLVFLFRVPECGFLFQF